jgi:hypothetical protein
LVWRAAGRTRSSPRLPAMAPAGGMVVAWLARRRDKGRDTVGFLTRRGRACLQGGGRPTLLAVRRAASVLVPAQRSIARTARHRRVRPAGEGAGSTWRGRGPQGLGVPPRLGTARSWEGASSPDAEAAYGAHGRSSALERGRRSGLPIFFRTGTI